MTNYIFGKGASNVLTTGELTEFSKNYKELQMQSVLPSKYLEWLAKFTQDKIYLYFKGFATPHQIYKKVLNPTNKQSAKFWEKFEKDLNMDICVFSFKKMLGCPPIECNKPCYLFSNKDVGKQYTGENFLKIKARRSIIKLQNDHPIKSIETIPESPEMKMGGFQSGQSSSSPKTWPALDR